MDTKIRHFAYCRVNEALKDGRLIRQPCEICGEPAQAHHDNYKNPIDIRWLCKLHHRDHHKHNGKGDKLDLANG